MKKIMLALIMSSFLLLSGCRYTDILNRISHNAADSENGTLITVLEVDKAIGGEASVTKEVMNQIEAITRTRLESLGYSDASIHTSSSGQVTVEIPSLTDTDEAEHITKLLCQKAELTFLNAEGEIVITGNDIEKAKCKKASDSEPYVELTFTSDAVSKFADATREAAAAADGNNFISIMMDDTIISAPSVSSEINSQTCIISGSFTTESARELANQINAGALPFGLKVVSLCIE